MKKWMLCLLLATMSPVFATSAAPADEASVRELLEVMRCCRSDVSRDRMT